MYQNSISLVLGRILKHGTTRSRWTKVQNLILAAGCVPASRRHLHLSPSQNTADHEWAIKKVSVHLVNELNIESDRPEGCIFHTKYLDSAANMNRAVKLKMPTLVAVHGSPGSHEDFIPIVGPLVEEGYRIVAFNQPGLFSSFYYSIIQAWESWKFGLLHGKSL